MLREQCGGVNVVGYNYDNQNQGWNWPVNVLDTASPGNALDLGSPNRECSPSGPGVGADGEPGSQYANCNEQGKALILQRQGITQPSDIDARGMIYFQYDTPVTINRIGVLDGKEHVEVWVR